MTVTADQLRQMALAMPEAEERETWGEATFRVRDKIFLMIGPDGAAASVKASLVAQAALIAQDAGTFSAAPYTGRYGWVSVRLAGVAADMLAEIVAEAWRRTAPKRIVAAYDAARQP